MKKHWKIFFGIVFVFAVLIVLGILFPEKRIDKIEKKPSILLIDAVDLVQDEFSRKKLYQWLGKNQKAISKEFELKGVILSYKPGSRADYNIANVIQMWIEKQLEKTGEKKPIWIVVPTLELGLISAENLFKNPNVFSETPKYLIFLVRHGPEELDLENLDLNFSGIKVIVITPDREDDQKLKIKAGAKRLPL